MNAPDVNSAIRKPVRVDWVPQEAFERFTRDMNGWWPTETHSVGKHESVQVVFETHQGGRSAGPCRLPRQWSMTSRPVTV